MEQMLDYFAVARQRGLIRQAPYCGHRQFSKLAVVKVVKNLPLLDGDREGFVECLQADIRQAMSSGHQYSGDWGELYFDKSREAVVWAG